MMFSKVLQSRFFISFCLLSLYNELANVALARVQPNESTLIFYYGPGLGDSQRYTLAEANKILSHPKFKKGTQTHLYIHGHGESQDDDALHLIINSYYKRKSINLIALEWKKSAGEQYFECVYVNVKFLAPVLADTILRLFNAGLQRESFTVVGHSLGGQLAGVTSRSMLEKTNGKVKIHRMVALDPAYPLYFPPFEKSVDKNDADHLQVIHTDIGTYGQPGSIGHIDFWPNGGKQGQPGCPAGLIVPLSAEDLCSHRRSFIYWAESVANVNGQTPKFLGLPSRSNSWFSSSAQNDRDMKPVEMGINCPFGATGNYYFKTNSKSPFAMGPSGY